MGMALDQAWWRNTYKSLSAGLTGEGGSWELGGPSARSWKGQIGEQGPLGINRMNDSPVTVMVIASRAAVMAPAWSGISMA